MASRRNGLRPPCAASAPSNSQRALPTYWQSPHHRHLADQRQQVGEARAGAEGSPCVEVRRNTPTRRQRRVALEIRCTVAGKPLLSDTGALFDQTSPCGAAVVTWLRGDLAGPPWQYRPDGRTATQALDTRGSRSIRGRRGLNTSSRKWVQIHLQTHTPHRQLHRHALYLGT